ncbi:RNA polymerase II large subunit CTD [Penicillium paradoxum]|uniref:RNA polymerase II large subunit CTD n=1 Tax=Penicillium paradoxum TaxID=176176 RepID=UPI00254757EE|nr:RNA polymerase II large subunit CTD [Penicillium paradoxum]KAJ5794472.1 RNA polymerase II large subunit CTD [Penicillium paradoxum]
MSSDEIAEDYKSSLEDLTTNDGIQIRTLTVIAKENTEHAMAISRVLENHIRSTPPPQKLPALYVADSIVKNVGSPYTLFLGRNMYQTFMNVYTLVDGNTRRKLDEMLNTWKQPAPGSLDTRPVFPPDITRNIESALIKARTAALQQQQARAQPDILGRNRGNVTPTGWTNSPTPPQSMPRHLQHPQYSHSHNSHSTPTSSVSHQQDIDLNYLNRDVDALIASAKNDFANSPFNPVSQQRLKALVDLQAILQKQQLAPEQLKLVRDQVSALAATRPASAAPHVSSNGLAISAPPQTSTPSAQPVSQPLQQLLNPSTLAELIKATASRQHSTPPPQIPASLSQMPQFPQPSNTPQPGPPENPLIAALRARGLLPGGPSPSSLTASASTAVPIRTNLPFILPNGMQPTPPAPSQTPIPSDGSSGVPATTASMKIPRFGLIISLYDSRPNRCGTCGRRFLTTEEGKEMKARHLDWHFKTNQRMTESSRRAQNRSWYVDERDWIKSREASDENGAADPQTNAEGAVGTDGNAKQEPPRPWIRAPNDATLRNTPCPICQEKFESTWSEDVQDWIWQDATKVGSRVYHASCYAEVTKGPAPTRQTRTTTPESVLGKRKAEGTESPGQKTRVKTEAV